MRLWVVIRHLPSLMDCGWTQERARLVKEAIAAHRYPFKEPPPVSVEAKILFDADKLDDGGP